MIPNYQHQCQQSRRRLGFSMLELLIVIAILALLATLGWAASMRLMIAQQRKNTQETVMKVGDAIRKQWSVAFDLANKVPSSDPDFQAIVPLAGGDMRKARAMFRKYYLRREFPTSADEAMNPRYLRPKQVYQTMMSQAQGMMTPDEEAGVCLYLILMQTRGGNKFDVDTALSARELSDTLRSGASLSNMRLKMVVDDWGYPLRLFRWPYQSMDLNTNGAHPMQDGDREDPDGALAGVGGSFSKDCHPVPGGGKSYKMEPVIVSAGENSTLDGYPGLMGVLSSGMKITNPRMGGSCIFSSSLRLAGHGDN